jgi:soluble lytic murein transglycosylase-like protein/tetratricopeptide (TPR) repeat protein
MLMMRGSHVLVALVAVAVPAWAGLEELARTGQWQQLLQVAQRRTDQLPLSAEEAYMAAVAAHEVGDRDAETQFLDQVADGSPFADLAHLRLAELLILEDAERAAELVLPMMRRAPTRAMREAAVVVAVAGLDRGLEEQTRAALEHAGRSLPTSLRRQLEVALAATDGAAGRERLGRVLASSTRDIEALRAARLLEREHDLTAQEQWWVAQALYRHALYGQAEPILEALAGSTEGSVPTWQAAYLRGRCAFREAEWDDAVRWYARALTELRPGERAAELEIHRARSHELAGRMDEAVAGAQRAVRLRTTDDRRLFLARLRLRLDQPDLAAQGLARVRGRSARARGDLMMALHDLRLGRGEEAERRLAAIQRQPWHGPATVLAADLAADRGDWARMTELLDEAFSDLDTFWAERARELMRQLPEQRLAVWRGRCEAEVAGPESRRRRRWLAQWLTLEPDPAQLDRLRELVVRETGVDGRQPPEFESGLAGELWRRGLHAEAVRWDPGGFPHADASSMWWSARQFLTLGVPDRAIRTADAGWRMAGADIPTRGYPQSLQRSLYPLPQPEQVWRASVRHRVPWSLLAALAREESRWQPDALSRVGARGVMQLLPGTAIAVAGRLGEPLPSDDELFDAGVSLSLGAAEIGRLLEVYGGQWAPAVAAYNAGEPQAGLWLEQCGDGCTEMLYVSHITFSATSRYTRDVLAAATVYSELYGVAPVPAVGVPLGTAPASR